MMKLSDCWLDLQTGLMVRRGPGVLYVFSPGGDNSHITNPADIATLSAALDARCPLPHAPASLVPVVNPNVVADAVAVAVLRELLACIGEYGGLEMLGLCDDRTCRAEDAARALLARLDAGEVLEGDAQ